MATEKGYVYILTNDAFKDDWVKIGMTSRKPDVRSAELEGDGDFRSPECVKLLDEADIVVTNPPFSIIDEYLDQLVKHGKKFLFIGPITMLMREDAFKLVQQNKMWLGFGTDSWYGVPDDFDDRPGVKVEDGKKYFKVKTRWFTNLDHKKRHEKLICVEKYDPAKYPKYANYPQAIEVGRIDNIPADYDGEMGVAITILDKFNPEQFEIVGASRWLGKKMSEMGWPKDSYVPGGVAFYLDESTPTKQKYRRLFGRVVIKRRKPSGENTNNCGAVKWPKQETDGLLRPVLNNKYMYRRILIRRRK